jgi:type IV pilus assembly protein PilQ
MGKVVRKIGIFFILPIAMLLSAALSFAAIDTNKTVSMQMDSANGNTILRIVTEKPIGYRYTIYASNDLARVVVNFPHMDIDTVSSLVEVNQPPVQKVNVSSHDLAWGRMGRVEIVLSEMADYDVTTKGNEFVLTLLLKAGQVTTAAVEPTRASVAIPAPVKKVTASASKIMNVDIGAQVVTLQANGRVGKYKFFSLDDPERLVVDVYDVKPRFEARHFPLPDDFSGMRIGVYKEKLRFVLDASGKVPKHAVTNNGESIVISWEAVAPSATNIFR